MILPVQTRERARRAHADHDWATAYDLLKGETPYADMPEEDLVALADAAWWVGDLDTCIAARERLYEIYSDAGNSARAAMEALSVALRLGDKGEEALAAGWRARAYRLAADEPGSLVAGYLVSLESDNAFHAGALDECVSKARAAREIGTKQGDPTLVAWCTHLEGLGLLKQGHVTAGWGALDESMVAISSGDIHPMWAGLMHCGMLLACDLMADSRRGWQWVKATERWLKDLPGAVLYPGVCRIHKVRFMQLNGGWPEAEAEAWRACEELMQVHVYTAARGYYEIAEIKRLRGDYEAAFELYQRAHELGFDPQPGLAQLRLAQGRLDAARAGMRRVLDSIQDEPSRAALLPHAVEIALVSGELEEARSFTAELSSIAERYASPGMRACAAVARGRVALVEGDAPAALRDLQQAVNAWIQIDCPYELARTRLLLAEAYRLLDDAEGSSMEVEAARSVFERLGADPDLRRTHEMVGGRPNASGLSDREVEVLRLITDGRSNKEISAALVISENTVARHIANIFSKIGVTSRAAAASFALKHDLV